MPEFYDATEPIPRIPGLITIVPAADGGGQDVLFETGHHPDMPRRGRGRPSRFVIGRVSRVNPDMLHPSDMFFRLELTMKECMRPPREPCGGQRILRPGVFLALQHAARVSGLEELLGAHFGAAAPVLLDLASCLLLGGRRLTPDELGRSHPLFSEASTDEGQLSAVLAAMIPEHADMPEVTSLHDEGFKRQIAAVCTALDFYAAWRKGRGGGTVLVYVPAASLFDMLDSPDTPRPVVVFDAEGCLPLDCLSYSSTPDDDADAGPMEQLIRKVIRTYQSARVIFETGAARVRDIISLEQLGVPYCRVFELHGVASDEVRNAEYLVPGVPGLRCTTLPMEPRTEGGPRGLCHCFCEDEDSCPTVGIETSEAADPASVWSWCAEPANGRILLSPGWNPDRLDIEDLPYEICSILATLVPFTALALYGQLRLSLKDIVLEDGRSCSPDRAFRELEEIGCVRRARSGWRPIRGLKPMQERILQTLGIDEARLVAACLRADGQA